MEWAYQMIPSYLAQRVNVRQFTAKADAHVQEVGNQTYIPGGRGTESGRDHQPRRLEQHSHQKQINNDPSGLRTTRHQ